MTQTDLSRDGLRAQMKAARSALPEKEREERSRAACERLVGLLAALGAKTAMFYLPVRGETDPLPAMRLFESRGGRAFLPRMEGGSLVPVPDGERRTGAFGIEEPCGAAYSGKIDAAVTPLLAADGRGNRLGWGKGYYDRFFAAADCPARIGLCYDFQIVPVLAAAAWDKPLTAIVTDKRTIEVNA